MALLPWLGELHQGNPILQLPSHTLGENVTVANAERSCVCVGLHACLPQIVFLSITPDDESRGRGHAS